MSDFNAVIHQLQDLEFTRFRIPDYQRPYVWTDKETRQLWDDIVQSKAEQKKEYRIGTIILHDNIEAQKLDIVDGQQRLTTLAILMHLLSGPKNELVCNRFLEQKQFLHQDSVENISANASEMEQWIADELQDKEPMLQYLLENCSMVEIRVSNVSEAFQMFDSQNGRGLTLEAYNLLKAYHIRYFGDISEDDKIRYDRTWEEAAKNKSEKDYLKQVIDEQLYRTRRWSKYYNAAGFTKKDIGEFKGSAIHHVKYPFQNFVNNLTINSNGNHKNRLVHDPLLPNTQINQPIINGTNFFEYVHNYVDMYKLLFEPITPNEELAFFNAFYREYCIGFKKKGDYYLLELYKSMVMLVFDRFGVLGLKKYYHLIYAYVFRFRLEKKFVKFDSVAKFPSEVISKIHHAKELLELNFLKDYALAPITRQVNNLNNDKVELFFKTNYPKVKIT